MAIDIPTSINLIASSFIGFLFGIASIWITYRYQRKRDNIEWEREKLKIEKQFEQEKVLLEKQFEQRLEEKEQQLAEQHNLRLREQLLEGLDNPDRTIRDLQQSQRTITTTYQYDKLGRLITIAQPDKAPLPKAWLDQPPTFSEMLSVLVGLPLILSVVFGVNTVVVIVAGFANENLPVILLGSLGLLCSLSYLIFTLGAAFTNG
jgi:hypothetical protein